jgi:hypothetical protein
MIAHGSKLGPHEILSALGAGGMGEVYRGRARYAAGVMRCVCSRMTGKPEIIHNEKPGGETRLDSLRNQAFALRTQIMSDMAMLQQQSPTDVQRHERRSHKKSG